MVCSWLPQTSPAQSPATPATAHPAVASATALPLAIPAVTHSPTPYDTALFTAIRSGDLGTLQQRLDAGSDANATQNGFSALQVATLAGTPQQMQLLIDRGAKPNYADADSITALWLAIPDPERTILLLDHGADPNMLSKEKYTPLVKLVNFAGTTGLFQTLVAKGADPKRAARDNSLLYWAASSDDTTLVRFLLNYGFHPNDTIFNGDYPLNSALVFRCSNTLKMLVDNGADVNTRLPDFYTPTYRGMTVLMQAAVQDDEPSFFYLLEHGADVNAKCKTGYTAMMLAQLSETDHPEMTKALIARGAKIGEKTASGDSAISLASKKGNTQSLQLLKQR